MPRVPLLWTALPQSGTSSIEQRSSTYPRLGDVYPAAHPSPTVTQHEHPDNHDWVPRLHRRLPTYVCIDLCQLGCIGPSPSLEKPSTDSNQRRSLFVTDTIADLDHRLWMVSDSLAGVGHAGKFCEASLDQSHPSLP